MKIKLIDRHKILSQAIGVSVTGPELCIYFLIRNKVIVYVGKTTSCARRIKYHRTAHTIDFDSFSFVTATKKHLDKMERAYIKMLEPVHNTLYTYKSGEQRRRDLYRRHLKTVLWCKTNQHQGCLGEHRKDSRVLQSRKVGKKHKENEEIKTLKKAPQNT